MKTIAQSIKSDYLNESSYKEVIDAAPTTFYFAAFTVMPANDKTGGTEVTIGQGGYARIAVTNKASRRNAKRAKDTNKRDKKRDGGSSKMKTIAQSIKSEYLNESSYTEVIDAGPAGRLAIQIRHSSSSGSGSGYVARWSGRSWKAVHLLDFEAMKTKTPPPGELTADFFKTDRDELLRIALEVIGASKPAPPAPDLRVASKRDPNMRCSFCGKDEVALLIACLSAYICDACVDLCAEIVREKRAARSASPVKFVAPASTDAPGS